MTLGSTIRGIGLSLAAVALYTTITAATAAYSGDLRRFGSNTLRKPSAVIELDETYHTSPEGYWWLCAARSILDGKYKSGVDKKKQNKHYTVVGDKNIGVNVMEAFNRYTLKECKNDSDGNPIDRDDDGFGDDCWYTAIPIPKEILIKADRNPREWGTGIKFITHKEAYLYLQEVANNAARKWF
ncbi:hypothetical protein DSCO28_38750 [Desulfosarcina ovata subsp. sediminis]|uniref:Uncharacterized protein n=1 Tax=Desulfosarcina ovata subsp. sediminis TaxID=885957 RepID=A0A5K7ZSX7_9BACT|nr:hypothetical protein [Desulfosarcina ovata]BBO83309.1 hypothetical protein DSCO28_38750 [Desulfosarcina ovata subsp. sediminis]